MAEQMDVLDLQQGADYLGLSSTKLGELAAAGRVPGAKVGRGWVFLRDDLREWLRAEIRQQTAARQKPEPVPARRRSVVPPDLSRYEARLRSPESVG